MTWMLEGSAGAFGAVSGAVVGLVLGSFAGMASWRWPQERDWISPSSCTTCGHRLPPLLLIPLLSWVWQRGRAACCGQPLSWRYPAIEGVMALLVGWAGWRYGISPAFLLLAVLFCTLVFLSAVDLQCGLIPDGANLVVALTGLGWLLAVRPPESWVLPVLSVVQAGGVGVLLAWGYSRLRGRDMLGWGDVKLMAASGLWFAPSHGPAYLLMAAAGGMLTGILWKIIRQEEVFPFGPALVASLVALIFWQGLGG